MDCRKARYFLVASFDAPLAEAESKELSYHLKDCRACRHESFYYRELFSAEKQLPARLPAADFNERLLSEIRMREARSSWPAVEVRRRPFRWSLVYVPALFGAAAAFSFLAFLPDPPAVRGGGETLATVAERPPSIDPNLMFQQEPPTPAGTAHRPRYVIMPRRESPRLAGMMFEWPVESGSQLYAGDPFSSQFASQSASMQYVRARSLERYVLPVISQTTERDKIY
jgi:hypothetical protein